MKLPVGRKECQFGTDIGTTSSALNIQQGKIARDKCAIMGDQKSDTQTL
jgi:hypothetical protein